MDSTKTSLRHKTSMCNRFDGVDISKVTVDNYQETLSASLASQIFDFLPPWGSFDNASLRRYLQNVYAYEQEDINSNMTLANRLRYAFRDLKPDTICGKFPQAELPLKRRLRCVAEYLIRSDEFEKLKDDNGKLMKKRGNLGKLVVIYKPLPKILETLSKQGLLDQ